MDIVIDKDILHILYMELKNKYLLKIMDYYTFLYLKR